MFDYLSLINTIRDITINNHHIKNKPETFLTFIQRLVQFGIDRTKSRKLLALVDIHSESPSGIERND